MAVQSGNIMVERLTVRFTLADIEYDAYVDLSNNGLEVRPALKMTLPTGSNHSNADCRQAGMALKEELSKWFPNTGGSDGQA